VFAELLVAPNDDLLNVSFGRRRENVTRHSIICSRE
jgi:hypothetical protein